MFLSTLNLFSLIVFLSSSIDANVVPTVCRNLVIVPTSNLTTTLTWTVPADTGGGGSDASLLTYYKVKRFDATTFTASIVQVDPSVTSYSFVLPKGTIVTAEVYAANAQGEGPEAAYVSTTSLDYPGPVTNLVVAVASVELSFTSSWTEPQDAGAGASVATMIYEYLFQYSQDSSFANTSSSGLTQSVSLTPGSGQIKPSASLTISGLEKGKYYYSRVFVRNTIGWSVVTVHASNGNPIAVQALVLPGLVSSVVLRNTVNQELTCSWVAPVEEGAGPGLDAFLSGVEAYNLQLGSTPGGNQNGDYTYTKDSPRGIFPGLTLGARYYVRIRAKNAVGYGNWTSNFSHVIAASPTAPRGVTAVVSGVSEVTVSWLAPLSSGTIASGQSSIVSFNVYRAFSNTLGEAGGEVAFVVNGTSTTFVSGSLTKGAFYTYTVSAENQAEEGPRSSPVGPVEAIEKPFPPLNFRAYTAVASPATNSNNSVVLSWHIPSDTGDYTSNVPLTNYVVQLAQNSNFSPALTSLTNATLVTNFGLTYGARYFFRIAATNAVGTSPFSSIISVSVLRTITATSRSSNAPTTGAVSVTLFCSGAGSSAASASSTLGFTATESTIWNSDTSLLVRVLSAKVGSPSNSWSASCGGSSTSVTRSFSFNSVQSLSQSISNYPSTGSVVTTVLGQNLASSNSDPTSTYRFHSTAAAASVWLAVTSIYSKTPPATLFNAQAQTFFSVSLGWGVTALRTSAFSVAEPRLVRWVANNLPRTGGASISLVFSDLGSTFSTLLSSRIRVAGSASSSTGWSSVTSLQSKATLQTQGSRSSCVSFSRRPLRSFSNQLPISFERPDLSSSAALIPSNSSYTFSGAQSVTVTGGRWWMPALSTAHRSTPTACPASMWRSSSSVYCKLPSTQAPRSSVSALLLTFPANFAYVSTLSWAISVDWANSVNQNLTSSNSSVATPQTLFPKSNLAFTGSMSVSVIGGSFLVSYGLQETPVSRLVGPGTACDSTKWRSLTSVSVKAPSGSAILNHGSIAVSQPLLLPAISLSAAISYDRLKLDVNATSPLSSSNAPSTSSASVTVLGGNILLGANAYSAVNLVGSGSALESSLWSSVSAIGGKRTSVSAPFRSGCIISISKVLSTTAPLVTHDSASPKTVCVGPRCNTTANIPLTGSSSLLIIVSSFTSPNALSLRVSTAATVTQASRWAGDTAMHCRAPSGWTFRPQSASLKTSVAFPIFPAPSLSQCLTWDSPASASTWIPLFSVSAANSTTLTGALSVTIVANNALSFRDSSPSLRRRPTAAFATAWIADSALKAKHPSYSNGEVNQLAVTVCAQPPSTVVGASLISSQILSIFFNTSKVANYPLTGSVLVTLAVIRDMGTVRVSSIVSIAETAAGKSVWLSTTSVSSKMPSFFSQQRSSGQLIISASRSIVTAVNSFSFNALSSLSSANATNRPVTGSVSVTFISFSSFSNSGGYSQLGSTPCAATAWFSLTSIRSKTNDIADRSRNNAAALVLSLGPSTLISVKSLLSTEIVGIAVPVPALSLLLTGSTSVTLLSAGLGTQLLSGDITLGRSAAQSSVWTSVSNIAAKYSPTTPYTMSISFILSMGVPSLTFTLSQALSFATNSAPSLSGSAPSNLPATGFGRVTLVLSSLFSSGMSNPSLDLRLGSTKSETSVWSSSSAIICKAPFARESRISICTSLVAFIATNSRVLSYESGRLVVSSTVSSNGPTTGSASITVVASGRTSSFGSTNVSPSLRVGASVTHSTLWNSFTSTRGRHTQGKPSLNSPDSSVFIIVTASRFSATSQESFTFSAANVSRMSRSNYPVTGSASTTVIGSLFGSASAGSSSSRIRLQVSTASATLWVSTSAVVSKASSGFGVNGKSVLTVNSAPIGAGSRGTLTMAISFSERASVLSSAVTTNGAVTGPFFVTLIAVSTSTVDVSSRCNIGGSSSLVSAWLSISAIATKPGSAVLGQNSKLDMVLTCSSPQTTFSRGVTFGADILIAKASPSNFPGTGTQSVTLLGTVGTAASLAVRFAFTSLSRTRWVSMSSLNSKSVPGSGLANGLVVTCSNLTFSVTNAITFAFESSSNLLRSNLPVSGAISITVLSSSTQASYNPSPAARISATPLQGSNWVSTTALKMKHSRGQNPIVSPICSVVGMVNSALSGLATFDIRRVALNNVTTQNAPSTGSTFVTVSLASDMIRSSIDLSGQCRIGLTGSLSTLWIATTSFTSKVPRAGSFDHGRGMVALTFPERARSRISNTISNAFSIDTVRDSVNTLLPSNVPLTAAISVTIFVRNGFYSLDFTPRTALGKTSDPSSLWVSTSAVNAKSPAVGHKIQQNAIVTLIKKSTLTGCWSFTSALNISLSISASSLPSAVSASTSVTILAPVFAISSDLTPNMRMVSSASETSRWISTTSLSFRKFSFGLNSCVNGTSALVISVAFGSSLGTLQTPFRISDFDFALSSSNANTSIASGAVTATILGRNLGRDNSRVSVGIRHLGASATLSTLWSSVSSVNGKVPLGNPFLNVNTLRQVAVSIVTAIATFARAISTDPVLSPRATSFSAFNIPQTGSISVTVFGTNVGPAFDSSVALLIRRTGVVGTSWLSQTTVFARASAGTERAVLLQISVASRVGLASSKNVSYNSESIFSVSANSNAPTSGSVSVTLLLVDALMTPKISIGFSLMSSSGFTSGTSITSKTVSGEGALLSVAAAGASLALSRAFSYNVPSTFTISANANVASTGSQSVSIISSGSFGTSTTAIISRIAATSSPVTTWVSDTTMIVKPPRFHSVSTSWNGAALCVLAITVRKIEGSLSSAFSVNLPTFIALSPPNSPTILASTGSVQMTMMLQNGFGLSSSAPARIGFSSCERSLWLSESSLKSKHSSKSRSDVAAVGVMSQSTLILAGQNSTLPLSSLSNMFSFSRGSFIRTTAGNSPLTGGVIATVVSAAFYSPSSLDCTQGSRLGYSTLFVTAWKSTTSFIGRVSAGFHSSRAVSLSLQPVPNGATQNVISLSRAVTFDSSTITAIVSRHNTPATGAISVTFIGKAFSAADNDQSAIVKLGTSLFSTATFLFSSTSIRCKIPATTNSMLGTVSLAFPEEDADIISDAPPSNAFPANFSVDSFSIFPLRTPFNLATTGGNSISITGANFRPQDRSMRLRMPASPSLSTYWIAESAAACKVGPRTLGLPTSNFTSPYFVGTISSRRYTTSSMFTYDPAIFFFVDDFFDGATALTGNTTASRGQVLEIGIVGTSVLGWVTVQSNLKWKLSYLPPLLSLSVLNISVRLISPTVSVLSSSVSAMRVAGNGSAPEGSVVNVFYNGRLLGQTQAGRNNADWSLSPTSPWSLQLSLTQLTATVFAHLTDLTQFASKESLYVSGFSLAPVSSLVEVISHSGVSLGKTFVGSEGTWSLGPLASPLANDSEISASVIPLNTWISYSQPDLLNHRIVGGSTAPWRTLVEVVVSSPYLKTIVMLDPTGSWALRSASTFSSPSFSISQVFARVFSPFKAIVEPRLVASIVNNVTSTIVTGTSDAPRGSTVEVYINGISGNLYTRLGSSSTWSVTIPGVAPQKIQVVSAALVSYPCSFVTLDCDPNAACDDSTLIASCVCNYGWAMVGEACVKINPASITVLTSSDISQFNRSTFSSVLATVVGLPQTKVRILNVYAASVVVIFDFLDLNWKHYSQTLLDRYEAGDPLLLSTLQITQIGLLNATSFTAETLCSGCIHSSVTADVGIIFSTFSVSLVFFSVVLVGVAVFFIDVSSHPSLNLETVAFGALALVEQIQVNGVTASWTDISTPSAELFYFATKFKWIIFDFFSSHDDACSSTISITAITLLVWGSMFLLGFIARLITNWHLQRLRFFSFGRTELLLLQATAVGVLVRICGALQKFDACDERDNVSMTAVGITLVVTLFVSLSSAILFFALSSPNPPLSDRVSEILNFMTWEISSSSTRFSPPRLHFPFRVVLLLFFAFSVLFSDIHSQAAWALAAFSLQTVFFIASRFKRPLISGVLLLVASLRVVSFALLLTSSSASHINYSLSYSAFVLFAVTTAILMLLQLALLLHSSFLIGNKMPFKPNSKKRQLPVEDSAARLETNDRNRENQTNGYPRTNQLPHQRNDVPTESSPSTVDLSRPAKVTLESEDVFESPPEPSALHQPDTFKELPLFPLIRPEIFDAPSSLSRSPSPSQNDIFESLQETIRRELEEKARREQISMLQELEDDPRSDGDRSPTS